MSILKKIKSVFIVPEEDGGVPQSPAREQNGPIQVTVAENGISDPEGKERFYQILSDVLEKNNLPGFDYIEFKKAVKSILDMHQMEEQAAYKTAYVTAQAMNVSVSNLMESAQKYLSILETEEASFSHSAQSFLTSQLSSRKEEKQSIEKDLVQIKSEIERLQQLLSQKESRLAELNQESESVQSRFDSNKVNFSTAYNSIISQIREDMDKMKNYLS